MRESDKAPSGMTLWLGYYSLQEFYNAELIFLSFKGGIVIQF